MILTLVFLSSLINLINSNSVVTNCDLNACPKPPKHYEELDCKEIKDENDCCPIKFECPNFHTYPNDGCQYKGRSYKVNEKLSRMDLTNNCLSQCTCERHNNVTKFNYDDTNNCTDLNENVQDTDCVIQFTGDGCCLYIICDKLKIDQLSSCMYEGKRYREGDLIYPEAEPCYQCYCDKNLQNTTAVQHNSNCHKIECRIEISDMDKVQKGCVPVYFMGGVGCCPHHWRCPQKEDRVVITSKKSRDSELVCKYGDLTMHKGDGVLIKEKCVKCECILPPDVYCTLDRYCEEDEHFNTY